MNRQGPNGIEWTDYTWNPVTGCRHGCPYCYAAAMARRFHQSFEPAIWPERLEQVGRVKAGSKVFVCSNADLFGEWVPRKWIVEVLNAVQTRPDVTFQFLTKNPARYVEFNTWPANCWVGATATDGEEQVAVMSYLRKADCSVRFTSLEPVLGDVAQLAACDWLIIGAQTGAGAARPERSWIANALRLATPEHVSAVFMKRSLAPYWEGPLRQEFPHAS